MTETTTKVVLHLHLYQPQTQRGEILRRIFHESYPPLIEAAERHPEITFSLDIAKSLGERLDPRFLARINRLVNAGRIELVNTAAYHYLLPLEPYYMQVEQLKMNRQFYEKHFPDAHVSGVFPPECAVSPDVTFAVSASGADWMLADDQPTSTAHQDIPHHWRVPHNWIPEMPPGPRMSHGLRILLRSHLWSETIANMRYQGSSGYYDGPPVQSGEEFLEKLLLGQQAWMRQCKTSSGYVALAVDGETFGHHHHGAIERFLIPFFKALAKRNNVSATLPSQLIRDCGFPKRGNFSIASGSWATSEDELRNGIPFPRWNHPKNAYHRAWNRFKKMTYASAAYPNPNPILHKLLGTAFYSCSPWWAEKENLNDRKTAGWCLPMFRRIIQLLPQNAPKNLLTELADEMQRFTA